MKPNHQIIRDLLLAHGKLRFTDLRRLSTVPETTFRRVLDDLQRNGIVIQDNRAYRLAQTPEENSTTAKVAVNTAEPPEENSTTAKVAVITAAVNTAEPAVQTANPDSLPEFWGLIQKSSIDKKSIDRIPGGTRAIEIFEKSLTEISETMISAFADECRTLVGMTILALRGRGQMGSALMDDHSHGLRQANATTRGCSSFLSGDRSDSVADGTHPPNSAGPPSLTPITATTATATANSQQPPATTAIITTTAAGRAALDVMVHYDDVRPTPSSIRQIEAIVLPVPKSIEHWRKSMHGGIQARIRAATARHKGDAQKGEMEGKPRFAKYFVCATETWRRKHPEMAYPVDAPAPVAPLPPTTPPAPEPMYDQDPIPDDMPYVDQEDVADYIRYLSCESTDEQPVAEVTPDDPNPPAFYSDCVDYDPAIPVESDDNHDDEVVPF